MGEPYSPVQRAERSVKRLLGKLNNKSNDCGPPTGKRRELEADARRWADESAPSVDDVLDKIFGDPWYTDISWGDIALGTGAAVVTVLTMLGSASSSLSPA